MSKFSRDRQKFYIALRIVGRPMKYAAGSQTEARSSNGLITGV